MQLLGPSHALQPAGHCGGAGQARVERQPSGASPRQRAGAMLTLCAPSQAHLCAVACVGVDIQVMCTGRASAQVACAWGSSGRRTVLGAGCRLRVYWALPSPAAGRTVALDTALHQAGAALAVDHAQPGGARGGAAAAVLTPRCAEDGAACTGAVGGCVEVLRGAGGAAGCGAAARRGYGRGQMRCGGGCAEQQSAAAAAAPCNRTSCNRCRRLLASRPPGCRARRRGTAAATCCPGSAPGTSGCAVGGAAGGTAGPIGGAGQPRAPGALSATRL